MAKTIKQEVAATFPATGVVVREISFVELACAGIRKSAVLDVDAVRNAARGLAQLDTYGEQSVARAKLVEARIDAVLVRDNAGNSKEARAKRREAAAKWIQRMIKIHAPEFKWIESESADAKKKRIARTGKKVSGALHTGTKAKSSAVVASAPVQYHADVWNKELMVRIGEIAEPLKATILKPSQVAAFDRATVAYALALAEIAKSK